MKHEADWSSVAELWPVEIVQNVSQLLVVHWSLVFNIRTSYTDVIYSAMLGTKHARSKNGKTKIISRDVK